MEKNRVKKPKAKTSVANEQKSVYGASVSNNAYKPIPKFKGFCPNCWKQKNAPILTDKCATIITLRMPMLSQFYLCLRLSIRY